MEVVWLYLFLEGSTAIYVNRKVTPVTICIYKEHFDRKLEKKYVFYINVLADCDPFVRHIRKVEDESQGA